MAFLHVLGFTLHRNASYKLDYSKSDNWETEFKRIRILGKGGDELGNGSALYMDFDSSQTVSQS